jgi:hypothetical protein
MNRESEGKSSGIPHLAKNERDVGHPSFVREQSLDRAFLEQIKTRVIVNCNEIVRQSGRRVSASGEIKARFL